MTRIVFPLDLLLLLILLLLGVTLSLQSVAILPLRVIWHRVKHIPPGYLLLLMLLLLHEFCSVARHWCHTAVGGLVLHADMPLVRLLNR